MREKDCYPIIHFAPDYGWLNDPNGLVWHDGIYELYYQSNPDGVEWANMTWSRTYSTDLTHWHSPQEAVLFPDENGLMFSGCGLVNHRGLLGLPADALLFPYTAAGIDMAKGGGKFTIRMAYSLDGGKTLQKLDGTILDELAPFNRDPAVFWHEETQAYILCLWLDSNDFGIFRSENLEHFELASRITLENGFECPDLFLLPVRDAGGSLTGEKKWVFWAADGSYFVGTFDGYTFKQEQPRRKAYLGDYSIPYAAQTWSDDPKGRVISAAWLRTKCVCGQTTGAVGLPRSLELIRNERGYNLAQHLVEEIAGQEVPAEPGTAMEDGAVRLRTECGTGDNAICLYCEGNDQPVLSISYHAAAGNLVFTYGEVSEFARFGWGRGDKVTDFDIIYDRGIIEVSARDDMLLYVCDFPFLRTSRISCVRTSGDMTVKSMGLIR